MKSVAVALLLLFAACDDSLAPPAPVWFHDVDSGLAVARKQNARGVMVDVWASWCLPCKQLARAYETPVMRRALAGWVRVRIDVTNSTPATDAFMERWQAGTPTVLFLSPDGKVLERVRDYLPPDTLATRVPRRQ